MTAAKKLAPEDKAMDLAKPRTGLVRDQSSRSCRKLAIGNDPSDCLIGSYAKRYCHVQPLLSLASEKRVRT